MILNHVKLEHEVIFIKRIASIVPTIFQPKTLIWSKLVLPGSNWSKVLEVVENEVEKTLSKSI